jgi:hypothetical protein
MFEFGGVDKARRRAKKISDAAMELALLGAEDRLASIEAFIDKELQALSTVALSSVTPDARAEGARMSAKLGIDEAKPRSGRAGGVRA